MIETEKPSFYAIIPANVRYDKELTANAKLLYGEITALCNEKGFCWASNEYFSKLYNVSKTSISSWISQLVKGKYITLKLIYREGTKEIQNRYIKIFEYPIQENLYTPIQENCKDNNTDINNTFNKNKSEIFKKPNIEEVKEYCLDRKNDIDPEKFIAYYESNGWMIGKSKMKNWKATIRTWELNSKRFSSSQNSPSSKSSSAGGYVPRAGTVAASGGSDLFDAMEAK